MKDGHPDRRTSQLLDQLGPESRAGENFGLQESVNLLMRAKSISKQLKYKNIIKFPLSFVSFHSASISEQLMYRLMIIAFDLRV